jgi:phage shock protein PspC (stress-responsive transcriptional regulator)
MVLWGLWFLGIATYIVIIIIIEAKEKFFCTRHEGVEV